MTRKQLFRKVLIVMSAFAAVILIALLSKILLKSAVCYDFIKDFSSLIIAIGAAYLAYCFQQRQLFLSSLRKLWAEILSAKVIVNDYALHMHPDETSYRKSFRSLSKAIDLVRAVYLNEGENQENIGVYTFEPLHDVRRSLCALGFMPLEEGQKEEHLRKIDVAWEALRFAFLREFDRPAATYPITVRSFEDPRRHPSSP